MTDVIYALVVGGEINRLRVFTSYNDAEDFKRRQIKRAEFLTGDVREWEKAKIVPYERVTTNNNPRGRI